MSDQAARVAPRCAATSGRDFRDLNVVGEAQDAEAEGIRINWLRTISSMGDDDLTVEIQELDEDGRPHGTGQFETLEADTVILALGQASDTGFLQGIPGIEFERDTVQVDKAHPDDRCPRHLRRW